MTSITVLTTIWTYHLTKITTGDESWDAHSEDQLFAMEVTGNVGKDNKEFRKKEIARLKAAGKSEEEIQKILDEDRKRNEEVLDEIGDDDFDTSHYC